VRILHHILFWIVVNALFCLNGVSSIRETAEIVWLLTLLHWPYANGIAYVLVPRYLLKGRMGRFFLLLGVWMAAGLVLNFLFRLLVLGPLLRGNLDLGLSYTKFFSFWFFIFMNVPACLLLAIKLFKSYFLERRRLLQLETEKMAAELQTLRSQVHPHFLFNTLNNLYSLIVQESDQAPEMVERLSGLLKYMLIDCNGKDIPLLKEIAFIKDYISLQQLRYNERLRVLFFVTGDVGNYTICPLLLIPLVENSFKHGIENLTGACWIELDLKIDNGELIFAIGNSKENGAGKESRRRGIGLQNVRKRLELEYKGNYSLSVQSKADSFNVLLRLKPVKPVEMPTTSVIKYNKNKISWNASVPRI
jgi:two-component system LytT family sensor kinase